MDYQIVGAQDGLVLFKDETGVPVSAGYKAVLDNFAVTKLQLIGSIATLCSR